MQARYYDPEIGRFLSVDPVTFAPSRPQQFNRYWYANGNPYRYTDPDGRCPNCVTAAIAGGIGFLVGASVNAYVQYQTRGSIDASDAAMAGASAGVAAAAIGFNPALAANPLTVAAITGSANVAGSVAADVANGKPINVPKAAVAGVVGTVAGPLGTTSGGAIGAAVGGKGGEVIGELAGALISEGTAAGLTVGGEVAVDAAQSAISGLNSAAQETMNELNSVSEEIFTRPMEEK